MLAYRFLVNKGIARFLSLAAWLLLLASVSMAQQAQQCKIEISSPRPGESVGGQEQIKGSAQTPAGTFLWVFVHVKGLALWWPQGGGAAIPEKGQWQVLAFFGVDRDAGKDFEIAAVALDSDANNEILKWYKRTEETGQYPGMRFPSSVKGCPIEKFTVTKNK